MGNAIQSKGHGHVKIMKLDGEVMKVKAPVTVEEIVKDYPGYVILHSEAVRHMGVRAMPFNGSAILKAKHLYFLVELPKLENYKPGPLRVRSGIIMNAKSKVEIIVLARRSVSDISVMKSGHYASSDEKGEYQNGAIRLKLRLTRAQLAKMMTESQNSGENAAKIVESCLAHAKTVEMEQNRCSLPWKPALETIPETCKKGTNPV